MSCDDGSSLLLLRPPSVPGGCPCAALTTDSRAEPRLWLACRLVDLTGYLHVQATRPDMTGACMLDSPASLAAWLLDKFLEGSENHGTLEGEVPIDRVVTNIMVR